MSAQSEHIEQTQQESLPTSPEELLAKLDGLGITYTLHHHAPMFTVADGEEIERNIEGTHCRNLFLRDKQENMVLVVAANETMLDLKKLAPVIGIGRISFGSKERLWTYLGIRPGSVCPFCIVNDTDKKVRVVLDADMMDADIVNYHPLDNAMTVGLSPADLMRFLDDCNHPYEVIDLKPAAPQA